MININSIGSGCSLSPRFCGLSMIWINVDDHKGTPRDIDSIMEAIRKDKGNIRYLTIGAGSVDQKILTDETLELISRIKAEFKDMQIIVESYGLNEVKNKPEGVYLCINVFLVCDMHLNIPLNMIEQADEINLFNAEPEELDPFFLWLNKCYYKGHVTLTPISNSALSACSQRAAINPELRVSVTELRIND